MTIDDVDDINQTFYFVMDVPQAHLYGVYMLVLLLFVLVTPLVITIFRVVMPYVDFRGRK